MNQINVTQQNDGSLIPHPQGEGVAIITTQITPDGKTGMLGFAGVNQAVLYFDASGQMIVSYHAFVEVNIRSIENIIHYLNNTIH